MQNWLVVVIAVVVLGAFLSPALGQDLLAEPVYTVHFDAPLEDVAKQLRREHGIHIQADYTLRSTRVVLDLEGATELGVLEAICRQVGAVYDLRGLPGAGTKTWRLRLGDWDADPRPQARVDDYTVYVEDIAVEQTFRWGVQQGRGEPTCSVLLGFRAEPVTRSAQVALSALRITEAVFDTGEEWTETDDGWIAGHCLRAFPGSPDRRTLTGVPVGVRRITRLRGLLGVFSAVGPATVIFAPNDVGVTKPMAGSELTLLEWKVEDGKVQVSVATPHGEPASGSWPPLEATLVDAAGESVAKSRGSGMSLGHGDTMRRLSWRFEVAEDQAVSLRVHGYVRVGTPTDVPFVIRDIPLP